MSDVRDFIYSPADAATTGYQHLDKRRRENKWDVPMYLDNFDKCNEKYRFIPLHKPDLMTLIMRPGMGKTSLMTWHAKMRATDERVLTAGNRAVVYVSVEQSIEEMYSMGIAAQLGLPLNKLAMGKIDDDEWERVGHYTIAKSPEVPVWYIGRSADDEKSADVKITIQFIKKAIRTIQNWTSANQFVIDIIYIDHLQELDFEGHLEGAEPTKVNVTTHNVHESKKLAFIAPVILAVQAKREVDEYKDRIPGEGDGQWTSGIEQISDKVMAAVYPMKFIGVGGEYLGMSVTENLWYSILWKQRFGAPNLKRWQSFDPRQNTFTSFDERVVELNNEPSSKSKRTKLY